ncbi:MAG: hypothetical protein WDN75_05940 [Bacteroidota bacterium]
MSLIAPTGMIFVPSKDGISHSPDEFTSAQDMANGASVLLNTILELDKSTINPAFDAIASSVSAASSD